MSVAWLNPLWISAPARQFGIFLFQKKDLILIGTNSHFILKKEIDFFRLEQRLTNLYDKMKYNQSAYRLKYSAYHNLMTGEQILEDHKGCLSHNSVTCACVKTHMRCWPAALLSLTWAKVTNCVYLKIKNKQGSFQFLKYFVLLVWYLYKILNSARKNRNLRL